MFELCCASDSIKLHLQVNYCASSPGVNYRRHYSLTMNPTISQKYPTFRDIGFKTGLRWIHWRVSVPEIKLKLISIIVMEEDLLLFDQGTSIIIHQLAGGKARRWSCGKSVASSRWTIRLVSVCRQTSRRPRLVEMDKGQFSCRLYCILIKW